MRIKLKQAGAAFCFSFLFLLLLCASCDSGGKVRKYKEKGKEKETASPAAVQTGVTGHTHFHWDTPGGWLEERKTSGLRLATFTVKSQDQTKESVCTIIPLKGEAGGLEANVTRWLGQITGKTGPPHNVGGIVDKLLKAQEKFLTSGQFAAVFIDFTPVTPQSSDRSILATTITVGASSIFIKMTGEKSHLVENKEKFKALCRSFRLTQTRGPGT